MNANKKFSLTGIVALVVLWGALIGGVYGSIKLINRSSDAGSSYTPVQKYENNETDVLTETTKEVLVDPETNFQEPESMDTPAPTCDSNYSGGCVPLVNYDLDCADIGFRVYVVGYDEHGFDGRDNDGVGCESH